MVSYAWWGCIKNCSKTVKLWNIITIWNYCFLLEYIVKCNLFLWCKAEFSASLLQSSVSHDPSEISLICWIAERFLIIIHVENSYAAIYFCGNHDNTSSRLFIEIEMSLMSLLIYLMQPCWIKKIIYIYIYIYTHTFSTYIYAYTYIYIYIQIPELNQSLFSVPLWMLWDELSQMSIMWKSESRAERRGERL